MLSLMAFSCVPVFSLVHPSIYPKVEVEQVILGLKQDGAAGVFCRRGNGADQVIRLPERPLDLRETLAEWAGRLGDDLAARLGPLVLNE